MCGIAGFVQQDGALGIAHLQRMTQTLARRGPDDEGYHCDARVGLGMRRLSIIDLAGGRQPLRSHSGRYLAVFNGEIYNYKELRQELADKGVDFQTHGDGEVLVNLYEEEGVEAFNRLRGMFGVAIWDRVEGELLLVRDQLGIKPLFYSHHEGTLLFGSEMKAILAALPGPLTVNAQALDVVLAYTYIPAPLTVWKDVAKLRPGHYLRWRDGKISEHRYWDLLKAAHSPPPSAEEIRVVIDNTIGAHMVSDVEVGAFLSGGLDSSTIVARMHKHGVGKPHAFTVRFDTKSHLVDETVYARSLRARYDFNLRVETLPGSNYSVISDAVGAFDEPFADDSLMPSEAISRMAAGHLKVVLSGVGGDEFFGGYNRYQGVALHEVISRLPAWMRAGLIAPALRLASLVLRPGSRRGDLLRRFARDLNRTADEAYLGYITATPPSVRSEILLPEVSKKVDQGVTRSLMTNIQERASGLSPVKRSMYLDVNTYLPEDVLALADRIGMWHSLEIRTPFADRVLAEFAFRIPSNQLVTMTKKKMAFRDAVATWLPDQFLTNPKQGFEAPTASWLRGEGAAVARMAFENHARTEVPLLNVVSLETLLREHVAGTADHAKSLFSALAVVEWARANAERIRDVG